MTLKTSSNKMNPALNLFGFTLRKNLGFTAIATVLVLLFSPAFIINTINQSFEHLTEAEKATYIFDMGEVIPAAVCILAVAAAAFAWLLQIMNFNYLNTKPGSDSFHSMPLNRTELFASRISACFISALIPLTAGYLGLFGVGLMENVASDNAVLLQCYIYTVGMMALCMLFSQIFIFASGCVFDSIISFLAVNIGIPVIIMLVMDMCDSTLFGYHTSVSGIPFTYGTPFGFAIYSLANIGLKDTEHPFTVWGVITYIIVIAALSALNIYLYNKRKSEKAGEPFAFKFVPLIISIIISFVAFHLFGYIFDGYSGSLFFMIMGIIGSILAAVVYNAIVNRGFKKLKAAIIPAVVSIVLVFASFFAIGLDVFGYETYVPTASNVDNVSVVYKSVTVNTATEEGIESVINLHSAIVEAYENDEFYIEDEYTEYTEENGETYLRISHATSREMIEINYTLKGGRTVSRIYHVANKLLTEEKAAFVKNAFADGVKAEFDENIGEFFSLDGEYNGESISLDITANEAEQLIDAYVLDLKNVEEDYFLTEDRQTVYINTAGGGESGYGYYTVGVPVIESFENSRAVLQQMNIGERNTFYIDEQGNNGLVD